MTHDELREVIAEAQAMLSFKGNSTTTRVPANKGDHRDSRQFVLETICAFCQHNSLDARHPPFVHTGDAFAERAASLVAFLSQATPNRTRQRMFMWHCLELLRTAWKPEGVATDARWFSNNIQRIPAIVDVAYPGYAETGLLKNLVAVMAEGQTTHGE